MADLGDAHGSTAHMHATPHFPRRRRVAGCVADESAEPSTSATPLVSTASSALRGSSGSARGSTHIDDDDDEMPNIRHLDDEEQMTERTDSRQVTERSDSEEGADRWDSRDGVRLPSLEDFDAALETKVPRIDEMAAELGLCHAELSVLTDRLVPPPLVEDDDVQWDLERELATIGGELAEMAEERDAVAKKQASSQQAALGEGAVEEKPLWQRMTRNEQFYT